MIKVKSGGMFAPQDKGPCKLTLIIPEDAQSEQNYAFSNLRYTDVMVGLASESEGVKTPLETAMSYAGLHQRCIDEILVEHGLRCKIVPLVEPVVEKQVSFDDATREGEGHDTHETEEEAAKIMDGLKHA